MCVLGVVVVVVVVSISRGSCTVVVSIGRGSCSFVCVFGVVVLGVVVLGVVGWGVTLGVVLRVESVEYTGDELKLDIQKTI